MQDYTIHRCTKRCKLSDRPLRPSENYYSVVAAKGAGTIRYDVAAEAWTGPPEKSIAWWQAVMPAAKTNSLQPTPTAKLLSRLSELCDESEQANLAYLLAMLLVRRKVLSISDSEDASTSETQSAAQLHLTCDETGEEYFVSEPDESFHGSLVQTHQQQLLDMLVEQGEQ